MNNKLCNELIGYVIDSDEIFFAYFYFNGCITNKSY